MTAPPPTGLYPIYEVHSVPTGQPQPGHLLAPEHEQEQMGSKRKFWFCDPRSSRWYLFKYSRENTGEHWSEKVACEIARLLGLPHAEVDLATHDAAWGVLVRDIREDRDRSLLHGNELLLELDATYPARETFRVSEHTVERVAEALATHGVLLPDTTAFPQAPPSGVDDALGLFVGYLLLDAIIGNTDRHHENWAVVVSRSASGARSLQLAPTYDHASSLGRELPDEKRSARMRGVRERGVAGYAERTRSAFYAAAGTSTALSPRDAFAAAGRLRSHARQAWLARCEQVGVDALRACLDGVDRRCITEPAAAFAQALIQRNYEVLVEQEETEG